jgi:hypothetical protein
MKFVERWETWRLIVDHGWAVEILPRHSREIFVFSKDGEVRGQIQVDSEDEKRRWLRAMKQINEPLTPENTSGTLINR